MVGENPLSVLRLHVLTSMQSKHRTLRNRETSTLRANDTVKRSDFTVKGSMQSRQTLYFRKHYFAIARLVI